MSRAEDLRAELALLDLEDEFVAAKEDGTVTPEMKLALRDARREFRERRAGSAAVAPEAIGTKTVVMDPNGGAA